MWNCWEIFFLISLLLVFLLFFFCSFFLSNEEMFDSSSPFECGMESISENRLPLNMQFFSVVFLFLIFDVELVLILPMIYVICSSLIWLLVWLIIFVLMISGLLIEINWSSVDWKEWGVILWI